MMESNTADETETNSNSVTGFTAQSIKQKSKKKRKRVSKHVLESQQKRQRGEIHDRINGGTAPPIDANGAPPNTGLATNNTATASVKANKSKFHVKDPKEALSYLTAWKAHQSSRSDELTPSTSASTIWKFHKNTQSWLIRHMYESDKVSKSGFALLMEYFVAGLPAHQRQRVVMDAQQKCQRYKDYEKQHYQTAESSTFNAGQGSRESKQELAARENIKDYRDDDDPSDHARWLQLDDHEKRKEYKRARKVIETLATTK